MAASKSTSPYSSPAARASLTPRRDPYFAPVHGTHGLSLGFRKMPGTLVETWVARLFRDGKYTFQSLGNIVEGLDGKKAVTQAINAAEAWVKVSNRGTRDTDLTVAALCAAYAVAVETTTLHDKPARPETAARLRQQYAIWVDADPIGKVAVVKLNKDHVTSWKARMTESLVNGKTRAPATINKDMGALRSALNFANYSLEMNLTPFWGGKQGTLKKGKADARRMLVLDIAERTQLLAAAAPDVREFLHLMLVLPVRPGVAARLTVADVQKHLVTVGKDKANGNRAFEVPAATAKHLARLCQDKLPGARLLMRADGSEWTAASWGPAIVAARKAAFGEGHEGRGAVAYTMRHCAITDMIRAQVPIAEVAQIAGTSVEEIERTYYHFMPKDAKRGLEVLANVDYAVAA